MLNQLKTGMERIYDGYELENEMAARFRKWENEIVRIAGKAGVADKLEAPKPTRLRGPGPNKAPRRRQPVPSAARRDEPARRTAG